MVVAHQVGMPRGVVALHKHIRRPLGEIRLAFDDVGNDALLERLGGGLVAGACANATFVAQCARCAVHEDGGGAVF